MSSPPFERWPTQLACCCADQDCARHGTQIDLCGGSLSYTLLKDTFSVSGLEARSNVNEIVCKLRESCIRPIVHSLRRGPEPALHAGL